jgi:crossover junction endodeoxyribonuclease RuvC
VAVLVDAIDMPTADSGRKRRVDAIAVAEWITAHGPAQAFVERAQAMPRQGASSGFSYGRSVGVVEAVVALHRIPMKLVEPSVWKRKLHLHGGDKEGARALALRLFPRQHELLARKSDHHRGEAALIVLASLPS